MYNIIKFNELDSSNTYAKTHIDELNNNDVIYVDYQISGHGRMARKWHATNESLTFSLIIKDKEIINDFQSLSLISSVAVFKALSKYIKNIYLKWPNDVIVDSKKICGILMEAISKEELDSIILGIGVNINNTSFPPELNATSLHLETNKTFDKLEILNDILTNLYSLLEQNKLGNKEYLKIFKEHNYLIGKKVIATINNQEEKVIVKDVLEDNRILVELDEKEYALSTGELTFHKN